MERDFKGIWIPKEIWLCEELSALDKFILAEIDSLDTEDHCTAGNEYLAEFCQCSERKVSESVNKLIELGYIELVSFDGRKRVLRSLVNCAKQGSKNCEAATKKILRSNIDIKIRDNKDNIGKPILNRRTTIFSNTPKNKPLLGGIEDKQYSTNDKKSPRSSKNLFQKCDDEILLFTNNIALQDALSNYLKLRLEMADKPIKGVNQWKGMLNKLMELTPDSKKQLNIVKTSTEKGWASFYEVTETKNKPRDFNFGIDKSKIDHEEEFTDERF